MIFLLLVVAVNFLAALISRPRIAVLVLVASSLSTIFLFLEVMLREPDPSVTRVLAVLEADIVFIIIWMLAAFGFGTVGHLLGRSCLFLSRLAKRKLLGRSGR